MALNDERLRFSDILTAEGADLDLVNQAFERMV